VFEVDVLLVGILIVVVEDGCDAVVLALG